jgi:hypothetical protein
MHKFFWPRGRDVAAGAFLYTNLHPESGTSDRINLFIGLFGFCTASNWIISRFCLEWALLSEVDYQRRTLTQA